MRNPTTRLPPPDLLLTFEAAARLLSFTRAAQERFVTQSAVSRQIRALEDDLGVALFRRRHRALALTEEGRVLQASCRDAFERLRETVERLRAPGARQVLTLTTTPGLAALWLIPRLAGFTRGNPGIDVRIDASFERREFDRDGIDIAIRYGRAGTSAGLKLFDEEVLPVCAPALIAPGEAPLREPRDLARHALLRLDESAAGPLLEWPPWFAAMGLPDLEPRSVLTFSNYDSVISAAIHGQGVALGRRPLVDAMLADGRLVAPLQTGLASPRAYFIETGAASEGRAPVQALVRWLREEACRSDPARRSAQAPRAAAGPARRRGGSRLD